MGFKESKWSLGVGAYGGARTGIYVKTKEETGAKEHFKSAYNLNKFHYGFAAELGRKGFAIFARYEATPLFKDNNPNQLQCDYIRNSFVKLPQFLRRDVACNVSTNWHILFFVN